MEDFKRPNHTDFMDTSELKKLSYSGVRHNSISSCMELWVLGEVVKSVSDLAISISPNAFNDAYAEHFGLEKVREEGRPDEQQVFKFNS